MKNPATIRIPNPSKELVAFLAKAEERKKERIKNMREKFLQTYGS